MIPGYAYGSKRINKVTEKPKTTLTSTIMFKLFKDPLLNTLIVNIVIVNPFLDLSLAIPHRTCQDVLSQCLDLFGLFTRKINSAENKKSSCSYCRKRRKYLNSLLIKKNLKDISCIF